MSWVNLDLPRWLHKIATDRKSKLFRVWPFLFCAVFALANNASAFTGTLNFSGSDAWLGISVTDGEANSTDIAGVVIEIYSASVGGNTNNNASWGYNDDLFGFGPGGNDEGILDEGGNGSPVIVIRTQGGVDFSFTGIKIVDYFGVHTSLKFEAFRDGNSVGSVTLSTDSGDYISDFNQSNGLTASIFQNIDEIRITDTNPANNIYIGLDNIGFANAVIPPPTVKNANISISGATGTSGAYKIGDTVTATWNNTAGGDNNTGITGVTVDFSQFGGGVAVAATNSGGVWTATHQITAGAIDTTNRNISVSATSAGGSTTTADTTNATVDNIAPTVTDGRINISGASGTGGAYKIGDTVTATWNNTAGGDNNSDTISNVTVNFSQFGGGAAVSASNSSGIWTATYTIVAGAIENTNRNVTVTATDNAGNKTATADTTNATVDNIAPIVVSITPVGGALSSDTTVDFTVTFSEPVSGVSSDDFSLTTSNSAMGSITGISGSGSSYTVTVTNIVGNGTVRVDLNASTNIVDAGGNTAPAAYNSGTTHTVNILTPPSAPTIGAATAGDGQVSVAFSAPGNNGGSAITGYTVTSNPGGITGGGNGFTTSPITVSGLTNGQAYTFTVTATNAIGTSTTSGASGSATPKADQTITFANPGSQNFGTTPTLTATTTASLTVSFSSSTTGVCTITPSGALTFVTAGSCTIDADQAGNASTNAAPTVSRTFTVNAVVPGAPTIGTATAGDTQADISFTAPASTGGAAITGYTVTSNPGGFTGTGAGSPVTVTGLSNGVSYTFTVTATNVAGTGGASGPSNSITPAAPQVITFANPGTQSFGTAPDLSILGGGASSTSGLTVAFTSSTTGVCTITSGGILTFVTTGTCTINVNQAGNSQYLPAPQVSRSFTVSPVVADAPTIGTAVAGDTQASVAFTAPANTGGTTITGYTVTVSPPDVAPVNGASSPIVVTGLTNGQAYTFTVTADNSAGTGPASGASNSITPKALQTITFNNPGARNFGTTPTFTATSDSGLSPIFTSATPNVCTITSLGAVTFITVGTCTINADQAGNGSYLAATQVTRSFTVNAVVPGAPTIGVATAGDAQASISFTAPTFNGGEVVSAYTVTSNPGGLTASGEGSPITIAGLNNGTDYTFTVTATNSVGTGSASASSNTVAPNGAPVIAGVPAASVAQDAAYSFTPTANDTIGDVLTFSISNKPAWASFDTASGALTGTPTNADVGSTTGIVITVSDGALAASLPAFSITVENINDAPVITGTPATSVDEDTAYSFIPTASDVDVGDVLTFSISNKPAWASFNTATGALTGTPTNADVGSTTGIVIAVSDGALTASLPAFSITVVNTNDAPIVVNPIADQQAKADALFSFQFAEATFDDVDAGDVLTYTARLSGGAALPSWLGFDGATRSFSGTPGEADIGQLSIEVVADDGNGGTVVDTFELVVQSGNEAPVIGGSPATQVDLGAAYRFVPTASDGDGDTLSFSATGLPSWLSVNAATGEVSGTAPLEAIGESYAIELTVSDGAETASISWNLAVVLQIGDITGLWLKDGELANERFGGALALFDATGDGLAEVYVGSPTRTVTVGNKKLKNAGGIDVLAASNGALLHRVNASVAKQRFGSALAVVADQNNDGIEDLIVGKPFAGKGGEIALHSGADGSLIRTLIQGEGKTASPIVSMMPLCAIDPQHIVCRILGSSEQGGRIGYSVTVADVDGSGGADLIVGLPQANVKTPVKLNKAGSVIVYQGLTDTPRYVINGQQAGERFGSSVAVDANYLLVGSPNFDAMAAKKLKDAGRVQLFNLQDGSVAGAAEGTAAKQLLGSAVASFNQDVNADGEPDWAAAGAGDKSGKPVKLFSGVTAPAPFAEIAVTAPKKVDAIRLASGMDINGDGISELVIGLPNTKVTVPFNNKTKTLNNAGQVQVVSGANWAP